MKSKILSLILPAAAFMLASAGAVGTSMSDSHESTGTPAPGWSRNAQNHCLVQTNCQLEFGPICTVGGAVAKGMAAPNQCTIDLYKLQ